MCLLDLTLIIYAHGDTLHAIAGQVQYQKAFVPGEHSTIYSVGHEFIGMNSLSVRMWGGTHGCANALFS